MDKMAGIGALINLEDFRLKLCMLVFCIFISFF